MNGVEKPIRRKEENKTNQENPHTKKTKPLQMAWEKSRKVELGRVGRKCKGHWVNGDEGREER